MRSQFMKLRKVTFSIVTSLIFTLSLLVSTPVFANEECIKIITSVFNSVKTPEKFPVETGRGLRDLSDERVSNNGSRALTQKDIELDQKLYKEIKGEDAPGIFKELMVDGVRFVDHELYLNARKGIVKMADSGEFISMRADIPYKGKNLGTNIGLNKAFFLSNYQNKLKSLVTKDAKAVVIFMHGGGTKTTGHHVAAQLSNHLSSYDVDVISLDMPWHAEGPRDHFANADEFVGWMRAFIDKYIKESGKPVFLAGHSMGGEMANIYLRASGKNDNWVDGVISLSPPVDPVPEVTDARTKLSEIAKMWREIELGGTYKEDDAELAVLAKLKEKFATAGKQLNEIGNTDEGILDETTFQGKNNPIGVLFEQILTVANTWKLPEHKGDDYLPALFAWGKYDYLLSGKYYDYINQYIAPLSNVDLKLYGHRETVGGTIEKIGHLIFDHYDLEKQDEIESFLDVRNFISKVIGKDLTISPSNPGNNDVQMISTLIREYAISLDFRAFVDSAKIERRIALDPAEFDRLTKEIQALSPKMGDKTIPDDEKKVIRERLNEVKDKVRGSYIPSGAEGEKGREIQVTVNALEKEYQDYSKSQKTLLKFYNSMAPRMNSKEKKLEELIRAAVRKSNDPRVEELAGEYEKAKELLLKETTKVYQAVDKHIDKVLSLGDKVTEEDLVPEESLYKTFREYEYDYFDGVFVKSKEAYENLISDLAAQGKLGDELMNEVKALEAEQELVKNARLALDLIEYKMFSIQEESNLLKREISDLYSGDVWKYETITLKEIFEGGPTAISENLGLLQEFWKKWKALQ